MRKLVASLFFMFSFVAAPQAFAQKAPVYTSAFNNIGVSGYDIVSFYSKTGAEKGSKTFVTSHNGADYRFVSQENLDLFLANPDAYLPQYGGYCAWAMADGKFAKGDPMHWSMVDGKLYLNFNKSIKKKWEKDVPGFIEAANEKWPAVLENN